MQRFIDLCHGFGIKVFHHDDGTVRPFLPELVAIGVDVLGPVQWVCPGMELAGLKPRLQPRPLLPRRIDDQRILPFGTPDEVRAEVRHTSTTWPATAPATASPLPQHPVHHPGGV